MKPHTVLIVDDSRTMRALLAASLSRDPHLRVVGEAQDPLEAREAVKRLNPDVITLDIEMPKMNGLDFLERLMRLRPTPVIVVSSLTEKGAEATVRALELGAVDCIAKPSPRNPQTLDHLAAAVRAAACVRIERHDRDPGSKMRPSETAGDYRSDNRIVAIGASMGGVEAISTVLSAFPENCPPTVITQHMPALFTRSFADRLDRQFRPEVREATDGCEVVPGRILIAPGGDAHLEITDAGTLRCRLSRADPVSGHRPSIDVMFSSLSRNVGRKAIGVILTGMGRDGAKGLLELRSAGAETIGQDEATSVVYGMPRAAFELGAVAQQLPLNAIAKHVLNASNALKTR